MSISVTKHSNMLFNLHKNLKNVPHPDIWLCWFKLDICQVRKKLRNFPVAVSGNEEMGRFRVFLSLTKSSYFRSVKCGIAMAKRPVKMLRLLHIRQEGQVGQPNTTTLFPLPGLIVVPSVLLLFSLLLLLPLPGPHNEGVVDEEGGQAPQVGHNQRHQPEAPAPREGIPIKLRLEEAVPNGGHQP